MNGGKLTGEQANALIVAVLGEAREGLIPLKEATTRALKIYRANEAALDKHFFDRPFLQSKSLNNSLRRVIDAAHAAGVSQNDILAVCVAVALFPTFVSQRHPARARVKAITALKHKADRITAEERAAVESHFSHLTRTEVSKASKYRTIANLMVTGGFTSPRGGPYTPARVRYVIEGRRAKK